MNRVPVYAFGLTAVLAMLLLTACGVTTGTGVKTSVSEFDGSRRVWINPHGTNCGMSMVCSSLGAEWSNQNPDYVALVVQTMGAYTSIRSVTLNIDGQFIELPPPREATQLSQAYNQPVGQFSVATAEAGRTSTQWFDVSLGLVNQILAARSVKLRVITGDGAIEGVVFDGERDSKAHHALQRFITEVAAVKH